MTNIDASTREGLIRLVAEYDDNGATFELCEAFAEQVRELIGLTAEPAPGVQVIDRDGDVWDRDPGYFGGRWVTVGSLDRVKREAQETSRPANPDYHGGGLDFDNLAAQYGPLTADPEA